MSLVAGIVGAIITAGIGAWLAFRERKSGIENAGKLSEVGGYLKGQKEVEGVEKSIREAEDKVDSDPIGDLRRW